MWKLNTADTWIKVLVDTWLFKQPLRVIRRQAPLSSGRCFPVIYDITWTHKAHPNHTSLLRLMEDLSQTHLPSLPFSHPTDRCMQASQYSPLSLDGGLSVKKLERLQMLSLSVRDTSGPTWKLFLGRSRNHLMLPFVFFNNILSLCSPIMIIGCSSVIQTKVFASF